ncbi:MAG: HNH endonuclease [Clostridia bacterium]|nr:HNH endonuclease [Clostridia bacterium]MBP3695216.1 HNH endonuclease [Thermoguttaceae bacterium]
METNTKKHREEREDRVDRDKKSDTYAVLPLKPCRRTGCPELVRGGGYCEKHRKDVRRVKRVVQGERGESGEWHGLYFTERWREMRAAQLIREPYCRECGLHGVRTKATDVDHIVPHRGNRTRFYDASNLQSLCHACHSRKTMAERRAFNTPPLP